MFVSKDSSLKEVLSEGYSLLVRSISTSSMLKDN